MGLIDYNFFYRVSASGCRWMEQLAGYYTGLGSSILKVRRNIVPSAMVDWDYGELFTVSLHDFGVNGPVFRLSKIGCWDGEVRIDRTMDYEPWKWAYGREDVNLNPIPWLLKQQYGVWVSDLDSETRYSVGFHNALQPCILAELNASDWLIQVVHYIPTRSMARQIVSDLADFEGLYRISFAKSDLSVTRRAGINRSGSNNYLDWGIVARNSIATPAAGNFQGFEFTSNPYYSWIFHMWYNNSCLGCQCLRCSTVEFDQRGSLVFFSANGGLGSSVVPRFYKVGSYAFWVLVDGYNLFPCRTVLNQADNNAVGDTGCPGNCFTDIYTETTSWGHTSGPYNYDFCILELDGTPTTSSSPDGDKIVCVFGLGGGGSYTAMTASYNWSSTYVNWTYNYAAGVICSRRYFSLDNSGMKAFAQNVIYVTDHTRASGQYVQPSDTSKTDEYRLYLNTHKIVPYTSPSGKHYLIYAYCYPGKKQHLYLGYAQYIIDSNYDLRLLSKCEFKGPGNNGWGDSFDRFTDCSRIISMDLKKGHLWITWVKDTNTDATGQSEANQIAAGHFDYFHILVSDLIPE